MVRTLLLLSAAAGATVALAACGSSSKPTISTRAESSADALGVRFATCMRSHGMPSFRDPSASDSAPTGEHPVDKLSPAFAAAQRACHPVMAELADLKPEVSRAAQLRAAECMRAHGVPNYPDPLPGGGFMIPSTINPQSRAFRRASDTCQTPRGG